MLPWQCPICQVSPLEAPSLSPFTPRHNGNGIDTGVTSLSCLASASTSKSMAAT
ncbi:hypothetical protein BDA96_08G053400 [Sorghum bicolor]|uniref:Uncharacterized protein n=1 Tax=Sorghum bicolor TaxID=4558 RepID=A0A921QFR6_SORBI|nr:hypothetical protein BDA96_08G053400 [Sorghum bicolor]